MNLLYDTLRSVRLRRPSSWLPAPAEMTFDGVLQEIFPRFVLARELNAEDVAAAIDPTDGRY